MTDNFLLIIWLHWLADFAMQSDLVATNKARNSWILGFHCLLYSLPFFLIDWKFAVLNGFLHFPVDFVTSRLTSYYWSIEDRHSFFVTIGFDQAVHLSVLYISLSWAT